jgi:aryl-alcohol dehydrogenase-like predicted oxidoreductase
VGEFIAVDRAYFVLATKYTLFNRHGDPNAAGNHRKNLVQSVERSLKRLMTEYIDLLWVHAWDFTTPVDEVMRALDDLVRAGKVLYVGISDTPAWIVSQANTMAELRGWSRFVGLQIEYNLIERTPERDLLPMAKAFDLGITTWAPLAGRALTGKYLDDSDQNGEDKRLSSGSKRLNERSQRIARTVVEVAETLGVTAAQVAINWTRQKGEVMVPIIGARRAEQIQDSLGCLEFEIPAEQMQQLDEVSVIDLGFPHEFLRSEGVRDVVFGGMYDKIKNHRR